MNGVLPSCKDCLQEFINFVFNVAGLVLIWKLILSFPFYGRAYCTVYMFYIKFHKRALQSSVHLQNVKFTFFYVKKIRGLCKFACHGI